MKLKVLTMAAVAATIALTSCSKEDGNSAEVSKYITIDAGVGSLTRTRATSTAFENNDQISVYSWTGNNSAVQTPLIVDNSINTYDGAKWTAQPQMLWKDNATAHYFLSVHPTKVITNFTADSYATTPDLLVATVLGDGRKATDGIVPLMFDHVMAKLIVNLTFKSQFEGTPTVEGVTTTAKPSATVNYLIKTAVADGTAAAVALNTVTANTAYQGTIVPQTVNTIQITINGKTFTYNNTEGFTLIGGKIQTVNLIVGRDEITLGSVAVNDWATGETIDGGEALD